VGFYTDRRPKTLFARGGGWVFTLSGLVLLSFADRLPLNDGGGGHWWGVGSAIFHPEASRAGPARFGRTAWFSPSRFFKWEAISAHRSVRRSPPSWVASHGQRSLLWFSAIAVLGIFVLLRLGAWYHAPSQRPGGGRRPRRDEKRASFANRHVIGTLVVLSDPDLLEVRLSGQSEQLLHVFTSSISFTFQCRASQWALFVFLFAVGGRGTFIGGPVGDRNRPQTGSIWISILGVAPFSLVLPYASLPVTIGADRVHWRDPGVRFLRHPGVCAGTGAGQRRADRGAFFFGLAFGTAGIAAALLGRLADHTSINFVFKVCAWLPLLGLLTALPAPRWEPKRRKAA